MSVPGTFQVEDGKSPWHVFKPIPYLVQFLSIELCEGRFVIMHLCTAFPYFCCCLVWIVLHLTLMLIIMTYHFQQGLFAFYKGFFPNFVRLGSWNVIMFLTLEQVRFFYFLYKSQLQRMKLKSNSSIHNEPTITFCSIDTITYLP